MQLKIALIRYEGEVVPPNKIEKIDKQTLQICTQNLIKGLRMKSENSITAELSLNRLEEAFSIFNQVTPNRRQTVLNCRNLIKPVCN